jgi:indolepyruvate ferredoxin oxidoreductase, beta subunit
VASRPGRAGAVAELTESARATTNDVGSLLLVGVGGQGVVLASAIIADAILSTGLEVKQSEVHGMAQRGGSVFSHLRFGPTVNSPLVPLGTADVLAGFEWAEALRWLSYLKPDGALVADMQTIVPPGSLRDRHGWSRPYPLVDPEMLRSFASDLRLMDALSLAEGLGNRKAANSVIVGAVAELIDVPDADWEGAIRRRVPSRTVDVNLAAFEAGRSLAPTAPAGFATTAETATIRVNPTRVRTADEPAADIEVLESWCKACDICRRVCPERCLDLDPSEQYVVVTDATACTACRLCEMLCPDFAIIVHPREESVDHE